jgi:chorismate mutase/prephenate dehydratase
MGEPVDPKLVELRTRLDALDTELQRLLNERARIVLEVGEHKRAEAQRTGEVPVFHRPEREAQILRAVAARNTGPYPTEAAVRLFREIISTCLNLELQLRIGYLGPEGTFTQAAALQHFGPDAEGVPLPSIAEVFKQVEGGALDYGVVPVENSTEGAVNHTLDSLSRSTVRICGEVALRIHHHLLAGPNTPERVTRIVSHQQSLAQCRGWLDTHWPHAERVPVASNGEAARLVAEGLDAAAIAGDLALSRYGLSARARSIEDEPNNTTRFIVIGRHDVGPSGHDKTALLVATRNDAGALFRILEPLNRAGINLTRLEARPARTSNWTYVFFLDLEGHIADPVVAAAVEEIRSLAMAVRVLGAFPRGDA